MLSSLKDTFSKTDEPVLITDDNVSPDDSNILFYNQAVLDITGYDEGELTDPTIIYAKDVDPQKIKLYTKARRQKDSFDSLVLGTHKSGSYYWIDLTMVPFHDERADKWRISVIRNSR